MNPFLSRRFKIFLSFLGTFLLMATTQLDAGVLLTKSKDVQIGTLTEDANGVLLQSEFGTISFKKEDLAWFSTDRVVDTVFKAAQTAYSQGDVQSALTLFEISLKKEPATHAQALSEMEAIRNKLVQSVTEKLPAPPPVDVDSLSAEEKIARGTQMVENGNRFLETTATDPKIIAANKATGEQLIKDGNALIARGQAELAERKAQEEADAARRREVTKVLEEANQSIQTMSDFRKLPENDKRNLLLAAGGFSILILLSLWQITMKEAPQS